VAQTFDPEVPSIARTYDYLLGGKDNFPADRAVASIFIEKFPGAVQIALDNRACLVRAVSYMTGELGLDQFLDLGSGLPTADNVHQVAQRINPQARVGYVDNDPQVLAHGRALLAENARTVVIAADLRQPASILSDPEITECPHCGGPLERVISAPAVSFKGGGWYADGYGNAKPSSSKGEGKSDSSSSSDVPSVAAAASASKDSSSPSSAPAAPAPAAPASSSSEKK